MATCSVVALSDAQGVYAASAAPFRQTGET